MAEDVMIRAEGLGKKYTLSHRAEREPYVALRDVLSRQVRALGQSARNLLSGRGSDRTEAGESFWALKDVSFDVRRGEVVGVIGRNGAGKSTLLKILSRITEPSEGRVTIQGRIASLLEVGTGFHPELTGRENIFLNGAILGMSRSETRRKFDEIVAFSEVEKFLDTPVKRYSSGMYVRLAFSVAAHLEPEILVVDEVLAVGDVEFQKKCLGKMQDVSRGGRTVLFVSHNMAAIQRLCSHAMVMDRGKVLSNATSVSEAVRSYMSLSAAAAADTWRRSDGQYENDLLALHTFGAYLAEPSGIDASEGGAIVVYTTATVLRSDPALLIAIGVYGEDGGLLFWSSVHDIYDPGAVPFPTGPLKLTAEIPAGLLNGGYHEIELIVLRHNQEFIISPGQGPRIRIAIERGSSSPFWDSNRPGAIAPVLAWNIDLSEAVARSV